MNLKYYLFILFSLQVIGIACAQNNSRTIIDSLQTVLNENPQQFYTYYELAEHLKVKDSTKALHFVKQGLAIAVEQNNVFGIGKGKFLLGEFYSDYEQLSKGEFYYKSADSVLSKLIKRDSSYQNLKLWARNVYNIGVVRSYQGYNEDIFYLNKIAPIAEKIGYYEILAKGNTNIAIGFFNQNQLEKAYEYFKIAGPQHLKANDLQSYATNKLIFASCLLQMDSLSRAKIELDLVEPVLNEISQQDKFQLYHTVLGEYYLGQEDYNLAIFNLKKAERILDKTPMQTNRLPLYMTFLKVFKADNKYAEGVKYANICLEIAQLYQNKVIESELYKELAYFQEKLDNYKGAFISLSKYVLIADSLNISELEKEINRLEGKYQSEKREREIVQLENKNDNVALQLAQKQSENYFLLLVSFGLLGMAIIAYIGYRNFKKRHHLKMAEIKELQYQQDSKVYSAMLDGQERERKRLAIDLHDGLAGRLSATRLKLEKLTSESKNEFQVKGVNDAIQNIDASLSDLRSIAMNLMPETLFKYGLKNAVEDYCSNIGKELKDIKFIIQFYDSEIELPKAKTLTIYRIIQELINNAVKHSKATEVLIQYLEEENRLNITVEDNGQGFIMNNLAENGGMGLNNLKTRVSYLNGVIDFDSILNEGTNVNIVIEL